MKKECTDHLGSVFKSEREMYKAWNVPEKLAQSRKKAGWSIERILTAPVKSFNCKDHLGNEYKTERDMYKAYNIPEKVGQARKKLGWGIERILTTPLEKSFTDHIGNVFKTEKEMYEHWGIPMKIGQWRKRKGWSLEQILTTPPQSFQCEDHLGNVFNSETERAKYWGLSNTSVVKRLEKGMSLEEALTTPYCDTNVKYNDPITNKVYTRNQLCKKYNLNVQAFRHRIDSGYNLLQALDISMRIPKNVITRIKQSRYGLTVVKRIKRGKDVFECYIDNGDGTSTFKIMTYDMIDQYCLERYKKIT